MAAGLDVAAAQILVASEPAWPENAPNCFRATGVSGETFEISEAR